MPSWRSEAPNRPRCQGRRVCVYRSEAETLDRTSGRLGAVFPQEGQQKRSFYVEFVERAELAEFLRALLGLCRHWYCIIRLTLKPWVLVKKKDPAVVRVRAKASG
jgi:hypothetical protein